MEACGQQPPGLQNLARDVEAPWVGSIPINPPKFHGRVGMLERADLYGYLT